MGLMGQLIAFLLCAPLALGLPQQSASPAKSVNAPPNATQSPARVGHSELGPFAAARMVPDDARVLIRVERASRLRRDLAQRPIARSLASLVGGGAAAKSWSSMARTLSIEEAQLFDNCFGRDFTYVGRADGEWVVITELGTDRTRDMLRLLQVRAREPHFGLAVSELPEQDVLLASDGDQVVVGPTQRSTLFFDVLERWGARDAVTANDAHAPTLARNPEFVQRLEELDCRDSRASVAAFIRHDRPLGGCSLIVADVRGDDVSIRQSARFDNPLFASPVTKLQCDFSPISIFADRALVAIMQPGDTGDGPLDAYLTAGLGVGAISPEMRTNLADRRMLIVGEADARQMPEARDILTTTFVACLELKNIANAPQQLDRQMATLAAKLNQLGDGAFLIQMPELAALRACQPRQANLGAAEEWFTGGFPVMKTVSLNWAVADSPQGKWFVIGSHPQALQETIDALSLPTQPDARMIGRFDSVGVANGLRLGRHVQSWSDEAPEYTDPENVARVRSTLQTFADLASGLTDCRWQMARPTATTLRLEIRAKLAPAETAGN